MLTAGLRANKQRAAQKKNAARERSFSLKGTGACKIRYDGTCFCTEAPSSTPRLKGNLLFYAVPLTKARTPPPLIPFNLSSRLRNLSQTSPPPTCPLTLPFLRRHKSSVGRYRPSQEQKEEEELLLQEDYHQDWVETGLSLSRWGRRFAWATFHALSRVTEIENDR